LPAKGKGGNDLAKLVLSYVEKRTGRKQSTMGGNLG